MVRSAAIAYITSESMKEDIALTTVMLIDTTSAILSA